jgi:hypothetical protein
VERNEREEKKRTKQYKMGLYLRHPSKPNKQSTTAPSLCGEKRESATGATTSTTTTTKPIYVQYLYPCTTKFHRTRYTREGSEFIGGCFTFGTRQGRQQSRFTDTGKSNQSDPCITRFGHLLYIYIYTWIMDDDDDCSSSRK